MYKVLTLLLLVLSFQAPARELGCAYKWAKKVLPEVENEPFGDKFKHCAVSCMIGLHCTQIQTLNIGVMKEIWDIFTPGDSDLADLRADIIGIKLSGQKDVEDHADCIWECDKHFD